MDPVEVTLATGGSSPPELEILTTPSTSGPPAMCNISLMSSGSSNDLLDMMGGFTVDVQQEKQDKTTPTSGLKKKRGRTTKVEKSLRNDDTFPLDLYAGLEVVDEFHHFLRQNKLPVSCHRQTALLYKDRFGSGIRGRCIFFRGQWITPTQFEKACGLQSCRDWRRSIKYGGQPILALINGGHLKQHATSCTCATCCEDAAVPGPVRLFVPHKKRRKNAGAVCLKYQMPSMPDDKFNTSHVSGSSEENITAVSPEDVTEDLSDLSAGARSLITSLMEENKMEDEQIWSSLDEQASQLIAQANALKHSIESMKKRSMKRKQDMLKQMARQLERYMGPIGSTGTTSQAEPATLIQKCVTCGNSATSECTGCHKAVYCSIQCQEKDWHAGHSETCQLQTDVVT